MSGSARRLQGRPVLVGSSALEGLGAIPAPREKAAQVLRLAKATATFAGGVDYIAWKINRHAGTDIQIKPWQRRWPLLAAVSSAAARSSAPARFVRRAARQRLRTRHWQALQR